ATPQRAAPIACGANHRGTPPTPAMPSAMPGRDTSATRTKRGTQTPQQPRRPASIPQPSDRIALPMTLTTSHFEQVSSSFSLPCHLVALDFHEHHLLGVTARLAAKQAAFGGAVRTA